MSSASALLTVETVGNVVDVFRKNEEQLSSCCKSDPVELFRKILQRSILSDFWECELFKSLDHSRVDPQLQVRYLLRLVSVRVSEDESVWEKFMTLLLSIGERQMYDYLYELTSEEEIFYDCLSEFTSDRDTESNNHSLDHCLDKEDVNWMFEVLVKVSHKWELIAVTLNFMKYQIATCRNSDIKLSLHNVLSYWLARDTSTPPGLTMNTLLTALRSETVGEGRVAQELEEKYRLRQSSSTHTSVASTSSLSLTDQSYDVEVKDGKSTLLQVQVSPKESVSYQWKKDGQPLANSCTYNGVNEDILVVSHASQGTEGECTCSVSYRGSEKCSNKITLTVVYSLAKKRLLNLYSKQREVVPPDSWPPVGTKSFIDLTVVRSDQEQTNIPSGDVNTVKNKVDYNEVFGEYISGALLVTKGRPGSGKTTLVHKIVRDWSKGHALRETKLVFLVTLRIVNRNATQETLSSILKSFYHNEEELKKVCEEIEAANGERVCFIIDGLDEYHPQDRDNSLIYQLLDKTFLPLAMVIVMSHPVAIETLREEVVTHKVEVLGFSKKQILDYIDSFPFGSSSCDSSVATTYPAMLKEYLYSHPNVFNMCYLPVHVAMICFLFKYKKGNIPNTQTKIYQEFTRSTILRHIRRHNSHAQVHSLEKLTGSLKDHFTKLCCLAYIMTISNKQVATTEIMEKELCEYVSSNSDEWCLGLVTINHIAELCGVTKTYSFLHLTVQEFLTAYYITHLEKDKQIDILSQLSEISSPTIVFYFGLTQFTSRWVLKVFNAIELVRIHDLLYHFALESQQQVVCDKVVEHCEGVCDFDNSTPSDLYAMGYVIYNTSHPVTQISIVYNFIVESPDITDFLERIRSKDFSPLQYLLLDGEIENISTPALSDILKSCTSLIRLELSFHEISHDSAKAIAGRFQYLTSLRGVRITCSSTSGGITTLLSGFTHLTNITDLDLLFYKLDSRGVFEVGSGLQLLANSNLSWHSLEFCTIDDDAATALANGLHSNVNIHHLDISDNNISPGGVITLLNEIHCLTKLTELYLSNNNIGCDGATALANQLQYLTKLIELDLSLNNIGPSGAVSLAISLHHLTELRTLDLSHNNIGPSGAVSLANTLHHLTELGRLDLSHNNIGPSGAVSLAISLHHLTELRTLYLSHNNIGPSGAVSLANTLHHLTELGRLDLSDNNIDLHSAMAVITASKDCPCLSDIELNTDTEDYYSNGVHVEGLVSPEDNTAITDLMTATQHPIIQRTLHLGFKFVILEPLT